MASPTDAPTSLLRPLAEELAARRAAAALGGGEERIARQHAAGKLTARERLALLFDGGAYEELGIHAGHPPLRPRPGGPRGPADGVLTAWGRSTAGSSRLRLRLHRHGRAPWG
jgi:acetyl-CoA carboxylase carboxyltransferase component